MSEIIIRTHLCLLLFSLSFDAVEGASGLFYFKRWDGWIDGWGFL